MSVKQGNMKLICPMSIQTLTSRFPHLLDVHSISIAVVRERLSLTYRYGHPESAQYDDTDPEPGHPWLDSSPNHRI
jgi:hypothetical protein